MTNNQVSTLISQKGKEQPKSCMFGNMSLTAAKGVAMKKTKKANLDSMVKLVKGISKPQEKEKPEKPMDLNFGSKPASGTISTAACEADTIILPAFQEEDPVVDVTDAEVAAVEFDNLMFGSKPADSEPDMVEAPVDDANAVNQPEPVSESTTAKAEAPAKKTVKPVKKAAADSKKSDGDDDEKALKKTAKSAVKKVVKKKS